MRAQVAPVALISWLSLAGCNLLRPPQIGVESGARAPTEASQAGKAAAVNPASAATPANAATNQHGPDAQALSKLMSEVRELGDLDPAAQQQLLEDLQKTDPALWPQLVQVFRATMQYRRQQREADSREPESQTDAIARSPAQKDGRSGATIRPASQERESAAARSRRGPDGAIRPADSAYPRTDAAEIDVAAKPDARADGPRSAATTNSRSGTRSNPAAKEKDNATPAAFESPVASRKDWRQQTSAAADALDGELSAAPPNSADLSKHATARFLWLLSGRRDDAARPIPGASPAQQDFLSKEIFGLAAYLDTERTPDASRRAGESALHLRDAAARLGEIAPLQVRNLTFCTEVLSYGVYKKFDKSEFRPGQELLLYAEVENFRSDTTDKGYHTSLKTSYKILDSRGQRVAEQDFPLTEEFCQNPRRDFFVRYFLWLPPTLDAGSYTLQLTIEDVSGQKIGQSTIAFSVKGK